MSEHNPAMSTLTTLTAENPRGWYECEERGYQDRWVLFWTGEQLCESTEAACNQPQRYTNFIGPLVPAPEWQPITSAPKDGTSILIGWAGADMQFVSRWLKMAQTWVMPPANVRLNPPTHWQPLPPPPPTKGETQ